MNEEERRLIGRRLKEARIGACLSQEAVAAILGIKRQAISKWEKGHTLPRSAEWYHLGRLYGASLDWLVYGIMTMPVSQYGIPDPQLASLMPLTASAIRA